MDCLSSWRWTESEPLGALPEERPVSAIPGALPWPSSRRWTVSVPEGSLPKELHVSFSAIEGALPWQLCEMTTSLRSDTTVSEFDEDSGSWLSGQAKLRSKFSKR